MKIRVGTIVKILVVVVIAVIAGGIAILKSIDLNEYRPQIAQKVEEATGRKLTLAGDIYLELFTLTPSIAIDNVSFANAPWGSQPEMATLKRLEVQVAILPLLSKQLEVQRFVLVEPKILLETDAKGQGNWQFETKGAAPAPAPSEGGGPAMAGQFTVHELQVEDGSLTYRDGKTKKETTIGLKDFSASAASASSPLKFSMEGDFNKAPFEVAGTIGSLADLQSPKQPFPVDVTAEAGGADVKLNGTIANPAAAQGLNLDLAVKGDTLAGLAVFAPGVPDIGPYSLTGHIGDSKGDINVTKLAAKLGNTDLAGNVTLVKAEKPTVRADLTSNVVDLVQLQEAAGGGKGGGGTAAPAPAPAPGGKIFSSAPLPLDGLKAANADVKLAAKKLVIKGPEVTNVNVALALNNGKLTVKPLTMDVLGGNISADTSLDAGAAKPALAVNANVKELDLATLVKQMKIDEDLSGKLNFEGNVAGAGGSVAQIMAGLNGKTHLWMNNARLDNTLLKIVMADLVKAATLSGDAAKINCLVSRFEIVNGLATSKQLVMDTESTTIFGKGTINLATEQLDMYLDPKPKAAAVVDLAIPVSITGPLSKPNVTPDAMAAAKKVGGAIGGVVTGGAIGGVAGGLLDKVTGGGESEAAPEQATSGDPCAMGAVATPAKATAPTAPAAGPAEAQQPAAQPEKPASPTAPIEDLGKDVGKTLKGIFE